MGITGDLGGTAAGSITVTPEQEKPGNTASSSFAVSFKNLSLGATITLFDQGWIANSGGNSDGKKLTLRLTWGPIESSSGIQLEGFYFVVDE